MKVNYDSREDILYVVVKKGSVVDSKELDEDIKLEFDQRGDIAGLEIAHARSNLAKAFAREIAKEMGTSKKMKRTAS